MPVVRRFQLEPSVADMVWMPLTSSRRPAKAMPEPFGDQVGWSAEDAPSGLLVMLVALEPSAFCV